MIQTIVRQHINSLSISKSYTSLLNFDKHVAWHKDDNNVRLQRREHMIQLIVSLHINSPSISKSHTCF
jgi:hypothetical protein